MKICDDCFNDVELKGFIVSQNQIGKCDICDKFEAFIIDIHEIFDFIKSLMSNFQVDEYSNNTLELLTLLGQKVKHKKLTFVKV